MTETSGYIKETTPKKFRQNNKKPGKHQLKRRFSLIINNITKKDMDYIGFMCAYLSDPERKYIPSAHPSYLIKFSLNFLLTAIKEDIENEIDEEEIYRCEKCNCILIVKTSKELGICEGCHSK
jgi:hypothetical protein